MKNKNRAMTKQWLMAGMSAMLLAGVMTGCGNAAESGSDTGADGTKAADKPPTPVTLTVGVAPFAVDEYQNVLAKTAAEKFPYITLEKVDIGGAGNYEETILSQGLKPDILLTGLGSTYLIPLKETGLAFDMDPLVKSNKLDLTQLDSVRVDVARNADGEPDLTELPVAVDTSAMYYNKDIFDRFGVAYPKDHLTWNQTIDLAKKLTRVVDDVQYRGLQENSIDRMGSQLGLLTVNPKTNKAALNSDGWNRIFTLMKQIYDIPGNGKPKYFGKARDEFAKTKDLALLTELGPTGFETATDLNWDLVTYPVFEQGSNVNMALGGHALAITSLSKHKDEAFQLLKYWLSAEVQTKLSASGIAPASIDPAAQKAYSNDIPEFKGKHLEALFMLKPANPGVWSGYEVDGVKVVREAYNSMLKGNLDVNTTLRTADETLNQAITDKGPK